MDKKKEVSANEVFAKILQVISEQKKAIDSHESSISDLAKSKEELKKLDTLASDLKALQASVSTLIVSQAKQSNSFNESGLTVQLVEEFMRSKDSMKGQLGPILEAIKAIKLQASPVTLNSPDEVAVKKPGWFSLNGITGKIDQLIDAVKALADKPEKEITFPNFPDFPRDATDPMSVRLSNGKEFIEQVTQAIQWAGGGAAIPRVSTASKIDSVPVVNPDGTNIGGGSGGGGAVTVADGADVAQGTTTDLASASTVIGLLKNLKAALAGTITVGGSVTVSGSVTANAGTNLNTSALALEAGNLATLAGIVTSARAAVNPIVGQAGVQGASGAVSATTQRVVLATDVALPTGANVIGALTANQSVNVAQINGVTPLMGSGNAGTGSARVTLSTDQLALAAWGQAATAGSVPAGATYKGIRGTTALPTAVTDGQLVGTMGDKYGRTVVIQQAPRDLIGSQNTTLSATTSETTIVTAAASVFNDLVALIISNTSASTSTRIDLRDDTAGTIIASVMCPPNQVTGFIPVVPIPQTAVNKNWTAQCNTSTTDIRIFAQFVKNR